MILFMIAFSACVGGTSKNLPLIGITISATILSLIFLVLPIKQYFELLSKPNVS